MRAGTTTSWDLTGERRDKSSDRSCGCPRSPGWRVRRRGSEREFTNPFDVVGWVTSACDRERRRPDGLPDVPRRAAAVGFRDSSSSADWLGIRDGGDGDGNGIGDRNGNGNDPRRSTDRQADSGRRTGRPALVRFRRSVALGPRAYEPGARGSGNIRRHGPGPDELDGLRLCGDRRGCRLADGLRARHCREDRPGRRQGYVDPAPGRIGTRRRRRDSERRVGGRRSRWGDHARRSQRPTVLSRRSK